MLRNDFVSNSSSSSFIVINKKDIRTYDFKNENVDLPSSNGNYEFGWQWSKYSDFWSKLNFCALQIIEYKSIYEYAQEIIQKENKTEYDKNWLKWHDANYLETVETKLNNLTNMLKKVCKENFNLNIEIRNDVGYGDDQLFAYIDHQSSASEGANMEMFNSEEDLKAFLASDDSYIKTGNDNDEPPEDDWYERK